MTTGCQGDILPLHSNPFDRNLTSLLQAAQKRARNAKANAGKEDKSQLKVNQANSTKFLCKVCFRTLDATKRMSECVESRQSTR